jgi:hypothetical protein
LGSKVKHNGGKTMELDLTEDREIFWGDELHHLTDHVDNIVFGLQHESDDWTVHKAFLELRMVLGLLESLRPYFYTLPALVYKESGVCEKKIYAFKDEDDWKLYWNGKEYRDEDDAEASGEPEGVQP